MSTLRRLTSALLFAVAVPAQALPSPGALPRPIVPVHASDVGSRTEIWAAGTTWKASFHDGMTFYPFVGPSLPHHPFAWRTTAIDVGATATTLRGYGRPEHGPDRVVYDLGPALERYDMRADGIEQSFVLPRPRGAGDLTIRGTVVSPLTTASTPPQHRALAFASADGRVRVDYGAAMAIDADGRRLPLATSCEGDEVRLHVPGDWLAAARFPVLVDPLISVGSITVTTGAVVDSDVLHETLSPAGGNGRAWVAHSFEAAAGDIDLVLARHPSGFGAPATTVFSRLGIVVSTRNGSLAPSTGSDRAVLFFDEQLTTGERYLGWHVHDVFDMTFDSWALFLLPPANSHYWRPDVGGRIDATGTEIVVVYQVEAGTATFANMPNSRVDALTLNPSLFPGGAPGAIWTVRNEPTRDQERPAINQAATEPEWTMAMMENDNVAGDDWDVVVWTVDGDGHTGSSSVATEEGPLGTVHQQAPQIAGAGGRYCLCYTTTPVTGLPTSAGAAGDTLRCQRIDYTLFASGLGTGSRPHAGVTVTTQPTAVLVPGGIAFDHVSASHWCATGRNTANETYRFAKLGYRGQVVETQFVRTAPPNHLLSVGGTTFRTDMREFLLVYGENGPGNDDVRAARVQYDPVAPPSLFGVACGPGAYTGLGDLADKQQIGAEDVTVGLGGTAPDTGIALLLISLDTAVVPLNLFGLGNCDLLLDPVPPNYLTLLTGFVSSAGTAEVTFDLIESLPPTTYYCQWLYIDSSNPLSLTFLATERLALPTAR